MRTQDLSPLADHQGFTNYCIQLARRGWVHGWYYPFLYQEHFDDSRSPNLPIRTDEDMEQCAPLSAVQNGVTTVAQWQAQLKGSAALVQRAAFHLKYYTDWRIVVKRVRSRLKKAVGVWSQW